MPYSFRFIDASDRVSPYNQQDAAAWPVVRSASFDPITPSIRALPGPVLSNHSGPFRTASAPAEASADETRNRREVGISCRSVCRGRLLRIALFLPKYMFAGQLRRHGAKRSLANSLAALDLLCGGPGWPPLLACVATVSCEICDAQARGRKHNELRAALQGSRPRQWHRDSTAGRKLQELNLMVAYEVDLCGSPGGYSGMAGLPDRA